MPSGSEEAQVGVCACGSWTLHRGSVHHSSDLSLPHGFALGVGLHPRVNATLHINTPHSFSYHNHAFADSSYTVLALLFYN